VEILMVLAILSITTVVSMPYLVKSIRGNRLRVAGATVVKAGRYAHTMALLNTREMKLILNLDSAMVRVEPRYGAAPESEPVAGSPRLQIARQLDAVRIDSVELEHRSRESAGEVTVIYRSNGRCTPYEVRLVDEFDNAMIINVDALSTAEARRETP
jgi:Tfp pilus assembly protein FimT